MTENELKTLLKTVTPPNKAARAAAHAHWARSKARTARARRSFFGTPAYKRGSATFSAALWRGKR